MNTQKVCVLLAVDLLIGAGVYLYFFGGPYRFAERHLVAQSLQHLRSSAGSGAFIAASPADAAFEYLYWWPEMDRPDFSKLDVSVYYRSPAEAVVTIINNDTQDDSVWRTCDRLTLRRESGQWLPVRHQAARQGRGRIGWTTQPTL